MRSSLGTVISIAWIGLALLASPVGGDARASEDETSFDLRQAWFVNPSGKGLGREFEAALDGYCAPLLAKVRPDEIDWSREFNSSVGLSTIMRYWAAVRMYDSGLCVEPDPTLGTRFFEHMLETETGHIGIVHMELGWRAWHGVGMAQDREAARRHFEKGTINRLSFIWDIGERSWGNTGTHTRTGMSLPGPAIRLLDWATGLGRTPREEIAFAWDLFEGRAAFPDGRPVPRDLHAISDILSDIPYHMDSNYLLGLVHREIERLGLVRKRHLIPNDPIPGAQRIRSSEVFMEIATDCGHLDAIKTAIGWYYRGNETDPADRTELLVLLLRLEEHGYDTELAMQEIEEMFSDSALDREDVVRFMRHTTTSAKECNSYAEFDEDFHRR
jgi:hypothetical protein